MRNLSIVPTVARTRFNDYAEDAVIVTEEVRTSSAHIPQICQSGIFKRALQRIQRLGNHRPGGGGKRLSDRNPCPALRRIEKPQTNR